MPSGAIEQLRELLTDYFQPLSAYQTHHANDAAKPGPLWLYREKHLLATDFSYKLSQIQIPDKESKPEYILAQHLKKKFDLEENNKPLQYSMSSILLSVEELAQLVNLAMNKAAGDYAKYATSLLITLLLRDADSTLNRDHGLALLEGNKLKSPKFKLNSNTIIPKLQVFFGSLLYTLMDDNLDPTIGNLGKPFVDLSHCHFYSELNKRIKIDGLSFRGQDLHHSQFRWLEFVKCNFAFCNLDNTQFEGCEGTHLIMCNSSLYHAQFQDCTFAKPVFTWATLRYAKFRNTQFGTDINNKAKLENCDFNNSEFDKHCSLQHIVENAGTQWVNAILPDNIRSAPLQITQSTSTVEHSAEIKYRSVKKKLFASANEHAESLPYYWTSTRAPGVKPLREKINHEELSWFIKELFGATSDYLYYQSRFEGVRLERAYRQGRLFSQLTSEIFNPLTHIGLLGCTEILNIEQYENKDWWSLYQKKKAELKEKLLNSNPAPLENVAWHSPEFDPLLQDTLGECILIHGNSNNIIDSILKHGFKRTDDEPGARGWGALGKGGPYLTDALPKAMQYTKCPSCDGEQCHCPDSDLAKPRKLLFCRVLLGRTQLTKNDKEHRYDAHQNVDYDTVYGPTNIEVPESHFSCNEFLPLEPAGKEPFFLHPNVYPEFIVTVRQHQKQLSKDHALELQKKYHSTIPIVEQFQKEFTKHEKTIDKFSLTKDPLNKIIECIETYYRLLNHQTPPKDKCLYALTILSENCKIALDYYKNIKDLSDLLEKLNKNIANEYEQLQSASGNTQSAADQLIESIRHEAVGHHYLCSALQTMKTDFSEAKSMAREAIMAFSSILSAQGPQIPTPAIAQMRLERALAHTLIDNHRAAIEEILFIHTSSPTNKNIKLYWNYCINLSSKLTLEMLIHILGQHSNGQKVNAAYYAALSQTIARAFGDSNKFKSGEAAVTFILACYQKLTRVEKINCIDALTKHPDLKPNDNGLLPLIERLRHAQEPDGWYYQLGVEAKEWEAKLSQSFFIAEAKDSSSTSRQIKLFKDQYKNEGAHFYFPTPEIEAQILKLFNIIDGTLKVKNPSEPGNHITLKVVDNLNKSLFWLKIAPEQAATEFSVNLLDRLATGHAQTPMTNMMLIQHVDNPTQAIAVQISSEAPGEVLSKTLNKREVISNPEKLAKLSLSSFLRHLLRVLLINPEDDKGDDYFLYQTEDGYELFRIDNERAFYKPMIGNPRDILQLRLTSTQVMQVKSILYCLEQMNSPLDQDAEARSVLEQFAALDCNSTLKVWLDKLDQWHQKYALLFRDIIADHYKKFPDSVLALTNPTESEFIHLVTRFESLQEIICLKLQEKSTIIGLDLLAVLNKDLVNPDLPNNYRNAFNNNPVGENSPQEQAARVAERFDQVTKGLYAFNPKTGRRYSTAPAKMISAADVQAIARSEKSPIVSKAREILVKLTEEKLSAIAKGILRQEEDKKEIYSKQNDSTKREIFRKIFAEIKSGKNPSIDGKVKEFILEILLGSPIYDVPLNLFYDCKIDENYINRLCRANGRYILKLNLDDCQFLTPDMLGIISEGCININTLSCRRSNLTLLRGTFPTLESLYIEDCTTITAIYLDAGKLKVISAANCQNLNRVQTGSYQLETVNFVTCSKLTSKSIAKLTLSPSQLRTITLESTKISASHRALAEAYPCLLLLPVENVSQIFVLKIKNQLDILLKQYSITIADTNIAYKHCLYTVLIKYLNECENIFISVVKNIKNWKGTVSEEALDFFTKTDVTEYHPQKVFELFISLDSSDSYLGKISDSPFSTGPLIYSVLSPFLPRHNDGLGYHMNTIKNRYFDDTAATNRRLSQITAAQTLAEPPFQALIDALFELLLKSSDISQKPVAEALINICAHVLLPLALLKFAIDSLLNHLASRRPFISDRSSFVLEQIATSDRLSLLPQKVVSNLFEVIENSSPSPHQEGKQRSALAMIYLMSKHLSPSQFQTAIDHIQYLTYPPHTGLTNFEIMALDQLVQHLSLSQCQSLLQRLFKLIENPNTDVQVNVSKIIGQISGHPLLTGSLLLQTSVDHLLQLLNTHNKEVFLSASLTLGEICQYAPLNQLQTILEYLFKLLKELKERDLNRTSSISSLLGKIAICPILSPLLFQEVIKQLLMLLKDSDPYLLESIIPVLGEIGAHCIFPEDQRYFVVKDLCLVSHQYSKWDSEEDAERLLKYPESLSEAMQWKESEYSKSMRIRNEVTLALIQISENQPIPDDLQPEIRNYILSSLSLKHRPYFSRNTFDKVLIAIVKKYTLPINFIERFLSTEPRCLYIIFSENYIGNIILGSLYLAGLVPKSIYNDEVLTIPSPENNPPSQASTTRYSTLFAPPPKTTPALYSTRSEASTSSSSSEYIATNSQAH